MEDFVWPKWSFRCSGTAGPFQIPRAPSPTMTMDEFECDATFDEMPETQVPEERLPHKRVLAEEPVLKMTRLPTVVPKKALAPVKPAVKSCAVTRIDKAKPVPVPVKKPTESVVKSTMLPVQTTKSVPKAVTSHDAQTSSVKLSTLAYANLVKTLHHHQPEKKASINSQCVVKPKPHKADKMTRPASPPLPPTPPPPPVAPCANHQFSWTSTVGIELDVVINILESYLEVREIMRLLAVCPDLCDSRVKCENSRELGRRLLHSVRDGMRTWIKKSIENKTSLDMEHSNLERSMAETGAVVTGGRLVSWLLGTDDNWSSLARPLPRLFGKVPLSDIEALPELAKTREHLAMRARTRMLHMRDDNDSTGEETETAAAAAENASDFWKRSDIDFFCPDEWLQAWWLSTRNETLADSRACCSVEMPEGTSDERLSWKSHNPLHGNIFTIVGDPVVEQTDLLANTASFYAKINRSDEQKRMHWHTRFQSRTVLQKSVDLLHVDVDRDMLGNVRAVHVPDGDCTTKTVSHTSVARRMSMTEYVTSVFDFDFCRNVFGFYPDGTPYLVVHDLIGLGCQVLNGYALPTFDLPTAISTSRRLHKWSRRGWQFAKLQNVGAFVQLWHRALLSDPSLQCPQTTVHVFRVAHLPFTRPTNSLLRQEPGIKALHTKQDHFALVTPTSKVYKWCEENMLSRLSSVCNDFYQFWGRRLSTVRLALERDQIALERLVNNIVRLRGIKRTWDDVNRSEIDGHTDSAVSDRSLFAATTEQMAFPNNRFGLSTDEENWFPHRLHTWWKKLDAQQRYLADMELRKRPDSLEVVDQKSSQFSLCHDCFQLHTSESTACDNTPWCPLAVLGVAHWHCSGAPIESDGSTQSSQRQTVLLFQTLDW